MRFARELDEFYFDCVNSISAVNNDINTSTGPIVNYSSTNIPKRHFTSNFFKSPIILKYLH